MARSHIINYTAATKGDASCPLPRLRACWVPGGIAGHGGGGGGTRERLVALNRPAHGISFTPSPQAHLLRSSASLLSAPKRCLSIHRPGTGVVRHTGERGPSADANRARDRGETAPGPEVGCFLLLLFTEKALFLLFPPRGSSPGGFCIRSRQRQRPSSASPTSFCPAMAGAGPDSIAAIPGFLREAG